VKKPVHQFRTRWFIDSPVHEFTYSSIDRFTYTFVEALMKKTLALMFVPLLLVSLASYGIADEVTLKASAPGEWTIYNSQGQDIGTLRKVGAESPEVEAGGYSILPKGGQYIGVVKSDGNLQLIVRHPVITPSDARLYLDVLEALKTLN
jgi:hypothetical protein